MSHPTPATDLAQFRGLFRSLVLDPELLLGRALSEETIARAVAEEAGKTGERVFTRRSPWPPSSPRSRVTTTPATGTSPASRSGAPPGVAALLARHRRVLQTAEAGRHPPGGQRFQLVPGCRGAAGDGRRRGHAPERRAAQRLPPGATARPRRPPDRVAAGPQPPGPDEQAGIRRAAPVGRGAGAAVRVRVGDRL